MDYSEGTKLYKYQWDNVHDPEAMVGWLQGDNESASSDQRILIEMILSEIRSSRAKGDTQLDLSEYGVGAYASNLVTLDDDEQYEIVVVTKLIDNKNIVNPQKYEKSERTYAMGRDGEFVRFELFTGTTRTLELIIEKKHAPTLEAYLCRVEDASTFAIELYEGDNKKDQDDILMISSTPAMPDIGAKVISANNEEFEIKLIIEYLRQCTYPGESRTPNQSESFPASGWHEVKANKKWDIDFGTDSETNRPKIRGGVAYLVVKSASNQMDTIRFFIKGDNPTVAQVNNYLNQAPYNQIWFFKKIPFHESGSPIGLGENALQYNVYSENHENLEDDWNAFSRCPNFGPPCGWGLAQLDNPAPPKQALWDWQANIRAGYDLLVGEKKGIVRTRMRSYMTNVTDWNDEFPDDPVEEADNRNEGGIVYIHGSSEHFQNSDIANLNNHFNEEPENDEKSFLDASWIKAYNGLGQENRIFYYLESNGSSKPTWEISNAATYGVNINYYVNSIGEQQTPD